MPEGRELKEEVIEKSKNNYAATIVSCIAADFFTFYLVWDLCHAPETFGDLTLDLFITDSMLQGLSIGHDVPYITCLWTQF